MGLFFAIAILSIALSVWVAWPLLLGGPSGRNDVTGAEVYRDQLRQLEADREEGLISDKDAASARTEIARRLLAVEEAGHGRAATGNPSGPAIVMGLIVALGLPLATGGIYLQIGTPGLAGQPLLSRADIPGRPDATAALAADELHNSDLDDLVRQLESRLKAQPDDVEGWSLLARSYITQGEIKKAADAYGKAIELNGETTPLLRGEQAELLTILNNGIVSPEAEAGFRAVLTQDPGAARSRFYLALAKAQRNQLDEAMADWSALLKSAEPGAPWVGVVTARIVAIAGEAGLDPADFGIEVPAAPQTADAPRGPTADQMAAAGDMSAADQQAMINTMVAGLRERLDNGEGGLEGWMRLARAYGVLGKPDEQLYAFRKAADLAPDEVETQLALANALMDAEDGRVNVETSAALNRVLRLEPDNPEALWNLGRAAADGGQTAQARQYWTRLHGLVSDNENAKAMVEEALAGLGE